MGKITKATSETVIASVEIDNIFEVDDTFRNKLPSRTELILRFFHLLRLRTTDKRKASASYKAKIPAIAAATATV